MCGNGNMDMVGGNDEGEYYGTHCRGKSVREILEDIVGGDCFLRHCRGPQFRGFGGNGGRQHGGP